MVKATDPSEKWRRLARRDEKIWNRINRVDDTEDYVRSHWIMVKSADGALSHYEPPERLPPEKRCWIWTGGVNSAGYGTLRYNKVYWLAHRWVWTQLRSKQPLRPNQQLNHRCDVRRCVNPDHLYLGTQSDNINDRHLRNPKKGPNRKLTLRQVLAIFESTAPASQLAREHGVGDSAIRDVRSGRKWAWFTMPPK